MLPRKSYYVLFASGRGTQAERVCQYMLRCQAQMQVSCLVCDQPAAGVIERVRKHSVPVHIVPLKRVPQQTIQEAKFQQEEAILDILKSYPTDWILLTGYMRILSSRFVDNFYDPHKKFSKIINIHPSLLPAFKGAHAYRDAFQYGVRVYGATIHLVTADLDAGSVLLQSSVSRQPGDSFELFCKRGLKNEHELYETLLDKLKTHRIKLIHSKPEERAQYEWEMA